MISLIFYFLTRFLAAVFVWLLLIGVLVSFFLGGGLCWKEYKNLQSKGQDNSDNYKNLAIFLFVMGGIFVLFTLCLCSQINLAIDLIKASSHFVSSTMSTLLVPIIHTVILAGICAIWISGFLYIFSIGEVTDDKGSIFGDINWSEQTKAYVGLMILGICWWIAFILAVNVFVLSSMAASWYFSDDNDGVTFLRGMCWAYTYHLGSLAFGSLIIAIIWFV